MNAKWFLITAGFSPDEMVAAAKRVEIGAKKLYPFARVIRISKENIFEFCPKLTQRYPEEISDKNPGFGYAAWKAEAVLSALNGEYGECDGVVWVDAGCEINPSLISRLKFSLSLKRSMKLGHLVFALNTPEIQFTKKKVWDLFPKAIGVKSDIQYQATYFILFGESGKTIAERIFEPIYNDFAIINPTILEPNESPDLQLPKCEQSLLSLTIKSLANVSVMKVPPAGNRGKRSLFRAILEPIWVARNRTGKSIIPNWIQRLP